MTNHAHVLACIANDPSVRLRDVATHVGITERAAQSIVADLVRAGFLSRFRVGRRNRYEVHRHEPLRHDVEANQTIGGLVEFLRGTVMTREYSYAPGNAPNGNGHTGNGHNGNGHNGNGHNGNGHTGRPGLS
jgi:hypothetical protein